MYTVSSDGDTSLPQMRSFVGHSYAGHFSPVIGKLVFGGDRGGAFCSGACLPVICDGGEGVALDASTVVGVVRISGDKKSVRGGRTDPYPSITLSELPEACNGKIALLDPSSATLFVSPDIATVNRYNKRLFRSIYDDERYPIILPSGKKLRFFLTGEENGACCGGDGILFDVERARLPEGELEFTLYEALRDVAETATGFPITVATNAVFPLSPTLRALFRSAVWGDFSLIFKSVLSAGEIREALRATHGIFCELESEGREFNGYIPKGVCVDTPFLLTERLDFGGIDLCCFNVEAISTLMTNRHGYDTDYVFEKILTYIERFRERETGARHSVILGEEYITPSIIGALLGLGIHDFYIPAKSVSKARRCAKKAIGY